MYFRSHPRYQPAKQDEALNEDEGPAAHSCGYTISNPLSCGQLIIGHCVDIHNRLMVVFEGGKLEVYSSKHVLKSFTLREVMMGRFYHFFIWGDVHVVISPLRY